MKDLLQSLALIRQNAQSVKKRGNNPHFKSKYATLEDVLAELSPEWDEYGILVTQEPTKEGLTTTVYHIESCENISFNTPILCKKDNDPQAYGSGVTYARRYALTSFFNLAVSDDDGNDASKPAKAKKQVLKVGTPEFEKIKNVYKAILAVGDNSEVTKWKKNLSQEFMLNNDVLEELKQITA